MNEHQCLVERLNISETQVSYLQKDLSIAFNDKKNLLQQIQLLNEQLFHARSFQQSSSSNTLQYSDKLKNQFLNDNSRKRGQSVDLDQDIQLSKKMKLNSNTSTSTSTSTTDTSLTKVFILL